MGAHAVEAEAGQRHSLPALREEERQRVLMDWNRTATEYPRHATVPELFDAQVRERPGAIAVSFAGEHLTYAELNSRVNQLARHLRGLGVVPEVPVAIFGIRSLEMVVGVLGILKAGGYYVPLEPDSPAGRQEFILQDTQTTIVLTMRGVPERLSVPSITSVCLDRQWSEIAAQDAGSLVGGAGADNLACVMYTSGSTGRPKGAGIVHRAIVRLVRSADFVRFGPEQVFLQLAPLAFDASTFEIWGALLNGSRLVMAPPQTLDTVELATLIGDEGVSVLWLTAGLFHQIADSSLDAFAGLRHLLAGGDVVSARHFNRVVSTLPRVAMTNGYGPTENTTFTCCHVATGPVESSQVPIGRPIANTQVYVLDDALHPVSVGVWGELYAAGDGLARCYLRQPGLTADRFVPSPFGEPGSRMYRTGDVVRYRADGTLEFRGRVDGQVKIRGFRVEPGEVEAVIARQERVRKVVVLARDAPAGDQRLVAYIVADADVLIPTLRAQLAEILPPYMIPSEFVLIERIPLTPNGKVDRHALAAAGQKAGRPRAPQHSPADKLEQQVADVWTEVLGIEVVGRDDEFFDLGGNSVLAMQLTLKISEVFGVRVPTRAFYKDSTVAGLARAILTQRQAADHPKSAGTAE